MSDYGAKHQAIRNSPHWQRAVKRRERQYAVLRATRLPASIRALIVAWIRPLADRDDPDVREWAREEIRRPGGGST